MRKFLLLVVALAFCCNTITYASENDSLYVFSVQKDSIHKKAKKEKDMARAFRYGIAAGAASIMTEGTQLIVREDFNRLLDMVKIQEV